MISFPVDLEEITTSANANNHMLYPDDSCEDICCSLSNPLFGNIHISNQLATVNISYFSCIENLNYCHNLLHGNVLSYHWNVFPEYPSCVEHTTFKLAFAFFSPTGREFGTHKFIAKFHICLSHTDVHL